MHIWSRRGFLKAAGTAGLGALLAPNNALAGAADPQAPVPRRAFGKSGIDVSILSMGGMFNIANNLLMMKQAVRWGVTYWDTADCYQSGSEKGIGKYFGKYPADRQKIFLVSKSDTNDPRGMIKRLERSLKRLHTDYLDLYFLHGIRSIDEMSDEVRQWAEEQKAAGKIRLFGFSTHSNMENCLLGAAQLGWVDGIMMTYNWRLMHTERMRKAVDACYQAGIGLTAMKTQGGGQIRKTGATEHKLAARFLEKGFTDAQAKIMAVWQNDKIASICSQMPNMTLLMANSAAARNRTDLSARDAQMLEQYARVTQAHYCAGCTDICEAEIGRQVPIGDVMRYLMYDRSYGEPHRARHEFACIPAETRQRMAQIDYGPAERKCPRNLAIGRLINDAIRKLA